MRVHSRTVFLDGEYMGAIDWYVDTHVRCLTAAVRTRKGGRLLTETGVDSFAIAALSTKDGPLIAHACNGRLRIEEHDQLGVTAEPHDNAAALVCWASGPGRVCIFVKSGSAHFTYADSGTSGVLYAPPRPSRPLAVDARIVREVVEFEIVYEQVHVRGKLYPDLRVDTEVIPKFPGRERVLGVGLGGACLLSAQGRAIIRDGTGGSFLVGPIEGTRCDGRWVICLDRAWDLRRPTDTPLSVSVGAAFGVCDDGSVFVVERDAPRWVVVSSWRAARWAGAWAYRAAVRGVAAILVVLVLAVLAQWLQPQVRSGGI